MPFMPSIQKTPRASVRNHGNTTLDLDIKMPQLAKDIVQRVTGRSPFQRNLQLNKTQ